MGCDLRGYVSHPSKDERFPVFSLFLFRLILIILFINASTQPIPSHQSSSEGDPSRTTPNQTSPHRQEKPPQGQGAHGQGQGPIQEGQAQGHRESAQRGAGSSYFLASPSPSPSHSHSYSHSRSQEQRQEQRGQEKGTKLLPSIPLPPTPIITTSPSASASCPSDIAPLSTQLPITTQNNRPNKGTASPFPSPPSSPHSSLTTSPPSSLSPSSPAERLLHTRSACTVSQRHTMAMATPASLSTSRNRSNDYLVQTNGYTDHPPTPHRRQLKTSKSVDNLAGRARSHTVDTGVQGLRNHFHHLYVDSPALTKTQLEAYGTPPSPADSHDRSSPIPSTLNRTGSGYSSGHSSTHGQDQDEPNHYHHRPRQQRPPQGQSQLRQDQPFSPNHQPYQNGASASSSTGANGGTGSKANEGTKGGLQVVQSNHVASRSTPKLTLYAQTTTQHEQLIKESKETRSFNGTPTAHIDSKPKAKSSRLKPIVTVENTNEDHVER